jgi:hypothetical protein
VLGKLFTQDVYAAVSDEMAEQAADLLAAFIPRKTPRVVRHNHMCQQCASKGLFDHGNDE